MFEWRDFLLVEGGPDRDRKVAGGIQHQAAALVAGLQAASTGGLYSSDATKLKFTGPSCDVNSLIRRGTKTRAGHELGGSNSTVFYSCPIEDGCWWLPLVRCGQKCLGAPA